MPVLPSFHGNEQLESRVVARLLDEHFHYRHWQNVAEANVTAIMMSSIPFLRAHISIVPHKTVTSHEHYYSYSKYANDLAFHSPETISDGFSRLSDVFADEVTSALTDEEWGRPIGELAKRSFESAPATIREAVGAPGEREPREWLQNHGKVLYEQFQIRQMLIVPTI